MDIGDWTTGDELTALLASVAGMFEALPAQVHRLTGADLDAVLPMVDRVAAVAAGTRFTLTAEAVERGEVAASQAGSTQQWVADRCPSLDGREAGLVGKAVRELTGSGVPAGLASALAPAVEAVSSGRLSVPAACAVAAELRQLTPLVEPSAIAAVAAGLVAMGQVDGAVGVRKVRPALLARYGLGEELQKAEDRHRGLTMLSCGRDIGGGITEYRMRLDPEARAVVEAAINTASAPQPTDGAPDPRTIDQRRGDALVDVCRRVLGRSASTELPGGPKTTVVVTIPLTDLQTGARPGVVLGGLDAGTLLGPETMRRLACDAAVVPVVVASGLTADPSTGPSTGPVPAPIPAPIPAPSAGPSAGPIPGSATGSVAGSTTGSVIDFPSGHDPGGGRVLHWGRTRRPFTSAQVLALWLRDRHCTFPGCYSPASWNDVHHVIHWTDGGLSDLDNATLLCGRHHTIVHRDRLIATLTTRGMEWDRRPGSYDLALARGPLPRSRSA